MAVADRESPLARPRKRLWLLVLSSVLLAAWLAFLAGIVYRLW